MQVGHASHVPCVAGDQHGALGDRAGGHCGVEVLDSLTSLFRALPGGIGGDALMRATDLADCNAEKCADDC